MGFRDEQVTVKALEEKLKELGGQSTAITSPKGEKFQIHFLMLQAIRLRQQVRYTVLMAAAVGVASVAQIVTVCLAYCGR